MYTVDGSDTEGLVKPRARVDMGIVIRLDVLAKNGDEDNSFSVWNGLQYSTLASTYTSQPCTLRIFAAHSF